MTLSTLSVGELHELRGQLAEELAVVDAEIAARQSAHEEPADPGWPVSRAPGRVRGRGPQYELHRPTCWSYPRDSRVVPSERARQLLGDPQYGTCPACRPDRDLLPAS